MNKIISQQDLAFCRHMFRTPSVLDDDKKGTGDNEWIWQMNVPKKLWFVMQSDQIQNEC